MRSFRAPFKGLSINCRQCHQVDEQIEEVGGGMRTYNDFARRSPVPFRVEDGLLTTARNSPPLVNASLRRPDGLLVHFDAEFPTLRRLVKGTIAGRNYGYLPLEGSQAIALVARVMREDDGGGTLAAEFGVAAYSKERKTWEPRTDAFTRRWLPDEPAVSITARTERFT